MINDFLRPIAILALSLAALPWSSAGAEDPLASGVQGARPILGQTQKLAERKEKEALVKKQLEVLKKIDRLAARLFALQKAPKTADSQKEIAAIGQEIEEAVKAGDKPFEKLLGILEKENDRDIELEAKDSGVPVDKYLDAGQASIWEGFFTRVKTLQINMDRTAPEALLAEQMKLDLRFEELNSSRNGHHLPENAYMAGDTFIRVSDAVFARLNLKNARKLAGCRAQ